MTTAVTSTHPRSTRPSVLFVCVLAGVLGILAARRARIQTPPTQVKRGSYLGW